MVQSEEARRAALQEAAEPQEETESEVTALRGERTVETQVKKEAECMAQEDADTDKAAPTLAVVERRAKVAAERMAKALLLGPDYADPSLEVDAEGYIVVKEYTGKCLATNTAHMRSHIVVPCSMVPRGPAGPPSDASSEGAAILNSLGMKKAMLRPKAFRELPDCVRDVMRAFEYSHFFLYMVEEPREPDLEPGRGDDAVERDLKRQRSSAS